MVACNTSTAVALGALRRRYDLPILGVIRPGASAAALASRNRRVGVIATPATIRSHAYFTAIKDENPAVEVYEHATPALVPLVEAGLLSGPAAEAAVAESLAPLLGERDASGEFIFPKPAGASIDTLLLGCTHYPLLRSVIAAQVGERVAIVDSATATASALAELLSVNGLEAPGSSRGTAADPGSAGHTRPGRARPARPPPAAHDRRPGAVPRARRPPVRVGLPGRRADRAGGRGPMSRRSSRSDRPVAAASPPPACRGATTGSGRPGSSIGSALGAAATVVGRHAERAARRGLVDWPEVERIAVGRLAGAPGALDAGGAPRRRAGLRRRR